MRKIAVISERGVSRRQVIDSLNARTTFRPVDYNQTSDLVSDFSEKKIDGLIFCVENFSPRKFELLETIKGGAPEVPVVVTYLTREDALLEQMERVKQATLLAYPNEIPNLSGVLKKMFQELPVSPRKHVRFPTEAQAEIHIKDSWRAIARMENVSNGGARVCIQDRALSVGDRMHIYVTAQSPTGNNWVGAKVVWERDTTAAEPDSRPTQDLGLSFDRVLEVA